jgi:hypothetical protein
MGRRIGLPPKNPGIAGMISGPRRLQVNWELRKEVG